GYWRHEGWGQPGAYNSVVHLVYDQHGTGSDPADTYYIRSTDKGVTFGTPVKLNTDSTTRPNWQPNLSVSPAGTVFATWYDGREAISGQSQQDAFTDRELVGFAVTTSDSACGSLINTQPTDFTINLSDPVNTGTVAASDFTVNGTPSNLPPTFMNGNATIIFH